MAAPIQRKANCCCHTPQSRTHWRVSREEVEREKDRGLAAKRVVGFGAGEALARGVTSRESRWLRR